MRALQHLRHILKTITQDVEVLPAVGGAVEDLERPDFEAEHRTAAFSARDGKVVFWYVRLRAQTYLDYPLMGVVKGKVSRLQKGELVISHATFRQPVKISFPRPAYLQEGIA